MRGREQAGRPPALSLGTGRPPPLSLGTGGKGGGRGRGMGGARPSLSVSTARQAPRPSKLTVGVPATGSIQGRGGRPAPLGLSGGPTSLGINPQKSIKYRERSEGGSVTVPRGGVYKRKSGTLMARRSSHRGGSGPARPMRPNADQMLAIRAEKLGYSQNFL